MLLLEHNGKTLLRRFGIPTPAGAVASDEPALRTAIRELPARLVLKAQIATGGRGKSGGIAFATGEQEALAAFARLKGAAIKGQRGDAVLVEERVEAERERYAAISIVGGEMRLLLARQGGVDVEEVSAADPANLHSVAIDPIQGPASRQLQDGFDRLGYAPAYWAAYEDVARKLFALSRDCDATLVEINPLAELAGGRLMALDARILIDDFALARQPLLTALQPDLEKAAPAPGGFSGLRFKENPEGGSVGLIGLGGGLNVTLMDWIASAGSRVAILVDIDDAIGAGHVEQGFSTALDAFDRNPSIKSILVNIITCGYRLDDIVAALLRALGKRAAEPKPTILHLRGNSMARTPQMLAAAGWKNSASITAAVEAAVAAARP